LPIFGFEKTDGKYKSCRGESQEDFRQGYRTSVTGEFSNKEAVILEESCSIERLACISKRFLLNDKIAQREPRDYARLCYAPINS
jgi:hypothetical protein